ncbi:ATP-dependent helicase HepA [Pirellula sp. SH-Sr6A]|uniref:DEAD/DEAH box helicase n=1 Tax=Pirellula sp. SH-Sr6A TaxID=1632865 RepID=UPI00078E98C8|nr:DEAD/DEAH box helicase [Pirellula sp. SH-Sr6A]AMV30742.1 ATP-dependent helicase HepA [Pirellula sp. SH-Sr6A]
MGTTADMDANSKDQASVELCESWSLGFDQVDASTYMPFGATIEFDSAVEVTTSAALEGFQNWKSIQALPIQLGQSLPKTIGFAFPEMPNWNKPDEKKEAPKEKVSNGPTKPPDQVSQEPGQPHKITRMRPPGDLVRLEDRLYYVLQPPLETIVQSAKLTFPFQPFPYQMEGIAFLFPRAAAILADEMGLGKTMQAITTIRMLLLSNELSNVLLICPKPLVTNWVREFRQWAPEIPVAVLEGDSHKRQWIWNNPQAPVKIANYELMMRDRDLIDSGSLQFDLVVLDEAQRIKNRNSTTSEIVRSIPRSRSWALTGTPIENSIEDLVSIFEFLSPGYLNDDMHLKSMGKATRDYVLRRTKDKVLTDMPPKLFRAADLDLTLEQRASYKSAEEEGIIQLNEMGDSLTIQHVFELVLRLKQICNFDPATGASAKLERLEADLEEVGASGQKAIIFSQWVETLDVLAEKLAKYNPLQYHGRIASHKRDGVIDRFKNDPSCQVILMSYGAGAVGLNLQFCHYVFLFDRWWNPAVEDQAINRAHRLGVKQPVTVTRMMSVDTIEQRIHDVLEEKRQLFQSLFAETGTPGNLGLSQKEIFGLFGLSLPKLQTKAA